MHMIGILSMRIFHISKKISCHRSKYFLYIYKEIGNRGLFKVNSKFCLSLLKLEEALQSAMLVRFDRNYIILDRNYFILYFEISKTTIIMEKV